MESSPNETFGTRLPDEITSALLKSVDRIGVKSRIGIGFRVVLTLAGASRGRRSRGQQYNGTRPYAYSGDESERDAKHAKVSFHLHPPFVITFPSINSWQ
jgi:hypothetical protein